MIKFDKALDLYLFMSNKIFNDKIWEKYYNKDLTILLVFSIDTYWLQNNGFVCGK